MTQASVLDRVSDVAVAREDRRRLRLRNLLLLLLLPAAYLVVRILTGDPLVVTDLGLPAIDPFLVVVILFFALMAGSVIGMTLGAGRSPHVTYRPEQLDVGLDDVVGIEPIKEDIVRSLDLFLAHRAFAAEMGGSPRRGLLFEGAPGTGKTYVAKALAREAGVPFLFVSATSFQSMYYGATARKIRSYFKALRKAARAEGGAIGFIEEIDAIAMARAGASPMTADTTASAAAATGVGRRVRHAMISEGTGGVVNELLVQMQSFDLPTGWQRFRTWFIDKANLLLPTRRQLSRPRPGPANILLIAATNRGDNLDPALLRPGRFDRRITFEAPSFAGRLSLVDAALAHRSHAAELDDPDVRAALAAVTQGYTPAMVNHMFDEALVNALRRNDTLMNRADLERARLTEEVGLGQPVAYTFHEQRLIATHEAGHATVAYLVAPHRRLDILSIVKRREALGMLAHGDTEDVFTRSQSELIALIRIAFGGQVAEEIFFGEVSTGPASDLTYATTVGAQMLGACGMGSSLISLQAVNGSTLSDTNLVGRVLADSATRAELEHLLAENKQFTHNLLAQNAHLVKALRDALLERHELVGTEILDILESARRQGAIDLRVDEAAISS
jgi:cell division protease FtsH